MVESDDIDAFGRSGLHWVAFEVPQPKQASAAAALLAAGADPKRPDKTGWTPLHFAAQEHALAVAEALVAAGAAVDAEDHHGNTPLWRAVYISRGRGEMIRFLLAKGADPDHANAHGVSPRRLSHGIANHDVARFFRDSDA